MATKSGVARVWRRFRERYRIARRPPPCEAGRPPDGERPTTEDPEEDRTIGVMSPYSLVEHVLGRRVRWRDVADPRALIEAALGVPSEELYAGRRDSPLYFRSSADLARSIESGRLAPREEKLVVARRCSCRTVVRRVEVEVTRERRVAALSSLFDEVEGVSGEWTPAGAEWVDIGAFSDLALDASDPVQGALGDCYLLAALSALAWTRPELLRFTLGDDDTITFRPAGGDVAVTLTEKVPVVGAAAMPIYARSSVPGEGWPGVYEKAWAKWKTDTATDKPDYRAIIGGNPAVALEELTGLVATRQDTEGASATTLFNAVVNRSGPDGRATSPMVAWTWQSIDMAPTPIAYSDTNVVANHAYTVLGWEKVGNARFVLLRNPYGLRDLTGGSLIGTESALFSARWEDVAKADAGVIALKIAKFKSLFRRLAWI